MNSVSMKSGVIGGLVGGVAFGTMMSMMDMMPMIAKMVGMGSAGAGWVIHLLISAATGALFVVIFGKMVTGYGSGVGYGILYGVIWWVLGALILMPSILGMGVQFANMFEATPMGSLKGHLVFGILLGLVVAHMSKKDPV